MFRCIGDSLRLFFRAMRVRRKIIKSLHCDLDWEIEGGYLKRNEVKLRLWKGPFGFIQHLEILVHDVDVGMPLIPSCCVKRAAQLHMLTHLNGHF